jgi:hypothetical protein
MGFTLKCDEKVLHVTLKIWENLKTNISKECMKNIINYYPQFKIQEKDMILKYERMKLYNDNENLLLSDLYLEFFSAHMNIIASIALIGVYDLLYNKSMYSCDTSKNIVDMFGLLSDDIHKVNCFNKLEQLFKYSHTNKQSILIL